MEHLSLFSPILCNMFASNRDTLDERREHHESLYFQPGLPVANNTLTKPIRKDDRLLPW